MELPTRTSPHNYIAIIKIFAMSLCTVSFTAFYLLFFPQTSLQCSCHSRGNTSEALWVAGSKATWQKSPTVPRNEPGVGGAADTTPTDALGWPSPSWSYAVLGKRGACKTCKSGALSQNILPGKWGGGRKMDLRFYTDSSIFNSFITKGKEENNGLKKKKATLELGLCTQEAGRNTHSV